MRGAILGALVLGAVSTPLHAATIAELPGSAKFVLTTSNNHPFTWRYPLAGVLVVEVPEDASGLPPGWLGLWCEGLAQDQLLPRNGDGTRMRVYGTHGCVNLTLFASQASNRHPGAGTWLTPEDVPTDADRYLAAGSELNFPVDYAALTALRIEQSTAPLREEISSLSRQNATLLVSNTELERSLSDAHQQVENLAGALGEQEEEIGILRATIEELVSVVSSLREEISIVRERLSNVLQQAVSSDSWATAVQGGLLLFGVLLVVLALVAFMAYRGKRADSIRRTNADPTLASEVRELREAHNRLASTTKENVNRLQEKCDDLESRLVDREKLFDQAVRERARDEMGKLGLTDTFARDVGAIREFVEKVTKRLNDVDAKAAEAFAMASDIRADLNAAAEKRREAARKGAQTRKRNRRANPTQSSNNSPRPKVVHSDALGYMHYQASPSVVAADPDFPRHVDFPYAPSDGDRARVYMPSNNGPFGKMIRATPERITEELLKEGTGDQLRDLIKRREADMNRARAA